MNRDDVIRMAREAGGACFEYDGAFGNYTAGSALFTPEELERFASLVAAAERKECENISPNNLDIKATAMPEEVWSKYRAAIRARGQQANEKQKEEGK